ncbi:hypothetical protein HX13_14120 [Chryseobacterium sp. P1-3]|uniref:DUF4258 domain-containing protein n=1 Tax=Chryseobacterium gallinarum TaxID=1324352 RepID=A0A0G3M965_CHRGL|nr:MULTISPECIES: hypothetical protein [Chryseobacterium]AKK73542.1 hypothetical protein OK18_13870 [Chryseobacterium gallinarum]KFF74256.1 hypothetical protein HX13_14120 [Chryseobacterium sp. P1-3]MCL8537303.1 hypothetical protein [Chryseobacterium gallinarum]QIY90616.1 hypothetical protein FOB44_08025 [Chryseobacterium gallinarum]
MKKLKFYAIGFIPGLLIVFFILNKKGASCSGYLPNSRVIAETLSKEFTYSDNFKNEMYTYRIDEKFIKDSIITKGKVDFDRSHAQKKPCPDYLLTYPEKNPRYEITFEKCEESVTLNSLKKLK